jgi:hypothetical protein
MNAVPTQEIQYPKEAGKLLGSQLGETTYDDFQTAKNQCNRLTQCSGVAYRQFNQKYTLRTGNSLTVPQSPIRSIVNGRLVTDPNIFDSYPKQISTTEINLNYLDQLIPERVPRSDLAMRIIENQVGYTAMEGFTTLEGTELENVANTLIDEQTGYMNHIDKQRQDFNADRESLNTKYLTLIYEIENQKDAATFYAIQRNLVLILVLLVLLVRNDMISQIMGVLVGGFVALIMAGYYVFSTYYNNYRRDPIEWNELSTETQKQAPPPTEPSCPSS